LSFSFSEELIFYHFKEVFGSFFIVDKKFKYIHNIAGNLMLNSTDLSLRP